MAPDEIGIFVVAAAAAAVCFGNARASAYFRYKQATNWWVGALAKAAFTVVVWSIGSLVVVVGIDIGIGIGIVGSSGELGIVKRGSWE